MKNMTKYLLADQLRHALWPGRSWGSHKTATHAIETMLDLMICHFQNGGKTISLNGFGAFTLRKRRAFIASHPRTGEPLPVPERLTLTFKPSAEVTRHLNNE